MPLDRSFLAQLWAFTSGVHHCARSVPSNGRGSSLGLPPLTVPSAFTDLFDVTPRILLRFSCPENPSSSAMRFHRSLPHWNAPPPHSPQGLILSLALRQRPLPALACPPPAPSPAAASPSARWAPGTGRSLPSWCRRASGWGPGAARDAGWTERGEGPRSRVGGADQAALDKSGVEAAGQMEGCEQGRRFAGGWRPAWLRRLA